MNGLAVPNVLFGIRDSVPGDCLSDETVQHGEAVEDSSTANGICDLISLGQHEPQLCIAGSAQANGNDGKTAIAQTKIRPTNLSRWNIGTVSM